MSSVTWFVGLAVVVVSAAVTYPLLFGRRPAPATVSAGNRRGAPVRTPRAERRDADRYDVRIGFWRRARSLATLLVVVAAVAATIAVLLAGVVLAVGLLLD